jgi:glycosyltransferase involved in cell wall biosynthesis
MVSCSSTFEEGKVSVLIPCHQHGHLLSQAVESVLNQSYQNNQIVIVNDGSTDNTDALAEAYHHRYPERIVYLRQKQQGQVIARKNGSALIRGEFLITLDADDILEPEMMDRCVAALREHPEAAAVAADVWMVAADGNKIITKLDQSKIPTWPDILTHNSWGGIAGIMIRSQSLQKVGWFNFGGSAGGEDWDIWIRFARSHQKLIHLPHPLARYRQTVTSHSRCGIKALKGVLYLLDSLTKVDPRLALLENVYPPIELSFYNWLRNREVFFHYGVAVASGENEPILREILDYCLLSDFDGETIAKSYTRGLMFVAQVQKQDNFQEYFLDRGLTILQGYFRDHIDHNAAELLREEIDKNILLIQEQSLSDRSYLVKLKKKVKNLLLKLKK